MHEETDRLGSAELRARRCALGLTQACLADALGVAPNTVARWERGERSIRNPVLISEALDRLAASNADNPWHNLPALVTTFIGRGQEVQALAELTREQRLVTLTGAGGCGKTRLALQVADAVRRAFSDGVRLVELAGLAEPALVAPAIATALNVSVRGNRSPLDRILLEIQTRRMLLLVDNCEHVLVACAELIDRLLHACPHLHVLATSREPLRIDGEMRWRVPPLSLPLAAEQSVAQVSRSEAVRLFVERARSVDHMFELDTRNVAAVARLCQRLDGMPLAIELAAARVGVLSAAEIVERLDDRFSLLTVGSRTAPPRHQTLRATLDWSFNLLDETQAALMCRLSVFAGSWSREAMTAICTDDQVTIAGVLDTLEHLVNVALVSVEDSGTETRYRLLESVRHYAAQQLRTADEVMHFRNRHLDWYAQLAEQAEPQLRGPNQGAWFDRLEHDLDNLRAALRWSLSAPDPETAVRLGAALWEFWEMRGRAREGFVHLRQLVELRGADATPRARAKLLWAAGSVALACGESEAARGLLEDSLSLARALDNRWHAGRALVRLGVLAFQQADLELAKALHEENLAIRLELGHQRGVAVALHNLGELALRRGDLDRAAMLFEDSLRVSREQADTQGMAPSLLKLGEIAHHQNDTPRARALYHESLRLNRSVMATAQLPECFEALARLAQDERDPERATRLWAASEALREELGEPVPATDWPERQRRRSDLRRTLGDGVFRRAWQVGLGMTVEAVIDLALAETEPPVRARYRGALLSERERGVAVLIAQGFTNRQIAERLVLSERTVDAHCRHIFDKLGVGSRTQVGTWAVTAGLVAAQQASN